MSVLKKTKIIATCLVPIVSTFAACRPAAESQSANSSTTAPTEQNAPATDSTSTIRRLAADEWLAKKKLSVEENLTVDALIASVNVLYEEEATRHKNPKNLAEWALQSLQIVNLSGKKLTNVSPILAFQNISHLHLGGNKFNQQQIDELLTVLKKLQFLAIDKDLNCKNANPNVKCIN